MDIEKKFEQLEKRVAQLEKKVKRLKKKLKSKLDDDDFSTGPFGMLRR